MILRLALAQIECFEGNISAMVKSADVVHIFLSRNQQINAYYQRYCDKLEASQRMLMLTTPTCEYTSYSPGLEVLLVNRTCTAVSDTFFYLSVHYTEQGFSQLLTVAYILIAQSSLEGCVGLLQLRYTGDIFFLRYKLNYTLSIQGPALLIVKDKQGIVVLNESLAYLQNYQGYFSYSGMQSAVEKLQGPDLSLFEAEIDFLVPFVYNESDSSAVQQSYVYAYTHKQWIYDRSLELTDCLLDLSVSQFSDRILLQYENANDPACALAGVNLITVEVTDGSEAYYFPASDFSFETPRYYIYNTYQLPQLRERAIIGFLRFNDGVSSFSYRKYAAVTVPCLAGLSLALRSGQLCVRAHSQCASSLQVRRYALYIYDARRGKSYEITDFYPLSEYCFFETDRKTLLRIEKQRKPAVFEIDDRDVYVFSDVLLELDYFVKYEDFIILAACSVLFSAAVFSLCKRYNGF